MKLLLAGISGYGAYYMKLLTEFADLSENPLCGVVDPYPENSPWLTWLREHNVPVYPSLEAFYEQDSADLVFLATPIALHRPQILEAMAHGSHVLCEKPLTARIQEALELRNARDNFGKKLGVGFQWSFCHTMQTLKKDILAGVFGRPISFSTFISWKRDDAYYDPKGWKGKVYDREKGWYLDSVATNATAHYLHGLLFLLGDTMITSAMPEYVEGSVYRARPIESFDTVFLRGEYKGCRLLYTATHVGEVNENPTFRLCFENGEVIFGDSTGQTVVARFHDGREIVYGKPQTDEENAQKILRMIQCVKEDESPACSVETILPHLAICNGIFDRFPIAGFPAELVEREESPASLHVKGLYEEARRCYEEGTLPDEAGCSWSVPSRRFSPGEITSFSGERFLPAKG